jgi:hypothetical protein
VFVIYEKTFNDKEQKTKQRKSTKPDDNNWSLDLNENKTISLSCVVISVSSVLTSNLKYIFFQQNAAIIFNKKKWEKF